VKFGSRSATFRAPVEGEVVALNSAVDAHPEFISSAPFESWFVELRPTNLAETVNALPVAERAATWARREYDRFKDLLAALTSPQGELAPQLADGGAPVEGVFAQLPPEAWDAAVKSFLDVTE